MAEFGGNRVQLFSDLGEQLMIVGGSGQPPGGLRAPRIPVIDRDGSLVFADGHSSAGFWFGQEGHQENLLTK